MGDVPEFAVTATVPSTLSVNPNGCGATSTDRPKGVIKRPLGMTVFPFLLIRVYKLPEGEETTFSFEDVDCPYEELIIRQKMKTKMLLTFMGLRFLSNINVAV